METISFTNPKCMKCPKNETCKNKTMICAYVDTDEIQKKSIADAMQQALQPLKMTPEMIQKEITKQILEISMGIDKASLMGLRK
ncbi:MAG: hypothetical protein V8Q75_03275 [Bacilli bacterium]